MSDASYTICKKRKATVTKGRCYGMEMNVEITKVMRISRLPTPVTIKE
jgi:hypothetical protein